MAIALICVAALASFAAPQAEAHHGCGNVGVSGLGFSGFNGGYGGYGVQNFGFHGQNVGNFGFHGHAGNFGFNGGNGGNNARVRGLNSAASPGGRRLVFVGFDRFGNPVFR